MFLEFDPRVQLHGADALGRVVEIACEAEQLHLERVQSVEACSGKRVASAIAVLRLRRPAGERLGSEVRRISSEMCGINVPRLVYIPSGELVHFPSGAPAITESGPTEALKVLGGVALSFQRIGS